MMQIDKKSMFWRIKKKLADFDQKNDHILEQIEIEKQKQKKAQKIMWLVKYEYHS